ncbi:MAG: 2'-5' RNA ligase family protein [Planctomycetota bacterium]|nr:2'-5' RNA ligase family protein [Planctomycetota bacterium]
MLLDTATEAAIRTVWERLRDEDVSATMLDIGSRPHVTLAVYNRLDADDFREEAAAFFAGEPPVPVRFSSAGTFGGHSGVAFLAPVVTAELLGLHARFHERFAAHDRDAWPYYRPGAWVPHATVGILLEPGEVLHALDIARTANLPLDGQIERAGVMAFDDAMVGPVEQLYELPLEG